VLVFSPSTYYAAKKREQEKTAREIRDEYLKKEIMRIWGVTGGNHARNTGRGRYGIS
jgi:putative transposase